MVGFGCGCCRGSDGRPLLRTDVGHEYFPQPGDRFMQVGDDGGGFGVKGGGWTFDGPPVPK